MMIFYTRSAHEAKRLARAVQTLTGKFPTPVILPDGRYRLQDETYSAEMATALNSLLRHGVRANQCTPERVTAELTRLMRKGQITASGTSTATKTDPRAPIPDADQIELPISMLPQQEPEPAPLRAVAPAPSAPLSGDALLAAFTAISVPRRGRAVPVAVSIPTAGGAVAEPLDTPAAPETAEMPDMTRLTTAEFAKRFGVELRGIQRSAKGAPGWKCKLIFVEEAEDASIFPARQHKNMPCVIPAVGPAEKLTVGGALSHLRNQAQDLSDHGEQYEGWCARHGRDTDSRMADAEWTQARRHLRDLRGFLGMALLRELLATRD